MNAVSVEGIEMVSMVQISEEEKGQWYDDYGSLRLSGAFYWNQERVLMFEEIFRLNGKNPGRRFLSQEQILVWKKTKKSGKRS